MPPVFATSAVSLVRSQNRLVPPSEPKFHFRLAKTISKIHSVTRDWCFPITIP